MEMFAPAAAVGTNCPTAYVDATTGQPVYRRDSRGRCILNRDMLGASNGAGNHYVVPGPLDTAPLPVCDASGGWYYSTANQQCIHREMCSGASRDVHRTRMCCRDASYPVPSAASHPALFVYACENPIPGFS